MSLRRPPTRARARAAFGASVATLALGIALAARPFPGGFDWVYTVMSALASRKHNPGGAAYFAAGLALSIGLLWPVAAWIAWRHRRGGALARFGAGALRLGIASGVVVGLERLLFEHFSELLVKGHEALSLLSFLSLYAAVLAFHAQRFRSGASGLWPAAIAVGPLVAIGLSQLGLYLDQRDLGWVDPDWRAMGIPFWLSFAFWQWLAAAALWTSIGQLALAGSADDP